MLHHSAAKQQRIHLPVLQQSCQLRLTKGHVHSAGARFCKCVDASRQGMQTGRGEDRGRHSGGGEQEGGVGAGLGVVQSQRWAHHNPLLSRIIQKTPSFNKKHSSPKDTCKHSIIHQRARHLPQVNVCHLRDVFTPHLRLHVPLLRAWSGTPWTMNGSPLAHHACTTLKTLQYRHPTMTHLQGPPGSGVTL
jgi:hypothetical protein